jgi:hypothetical protein
VQTGSNGFAIAPSKTAAEMPFYTLTAYYIYFRPKYRLVVKKVCSIMVRLRGGFIYKGLMKIAVGCTHHQMWM